MSTTISAVLRPVDCDDDDDDDETMMTETPMEEKETKDELDTNHDSVLMFPKWHSHRDRPNRPMFPIVDVR